MDANVAYQFLAAAVEHHQFASAAQQTHDGLSAVAGSGYSMAASDAEDLVGLVQHSFAAAVGLVEALSPALGPAGKSGRTLNATQRQVKAMSSQEERQASGLQLALLLFSTACTAPSFFPDGYWHSAEQIPTAALFLNEAKRFMVDPKSPTNLRLDSLLLGQRIVEAVGPMTARALLPGLASALCKAVAAQGNAPPKVAISQIQLLADALLKCFAAVDAEATSSQSNPAEALADECRRLAAAGGSSSSVNGKGVSQPTPSEGSPPVGTEAMDAWEAASLPKLTPLLGLLLLDVEGSTTVSAAKWFPADYSHSSSSAVEALVYRLCVPMLGTRCVSQPAGHTLRRMLLDTVVLLLSASSVGGGEDSVAALVASLLPPDAVAFAKERCGALFLGSSPSSFVALIPGYCRLAAVPVGPYLLADWDPAAEGQSASGGGGEGGPHLLPRWVRCFVAEYNRLCHSDRSFYAALAVAARGNSLQTDSPSSEGSSLADRLQRAHEGASEGSRLTADQRGVFRFARFVGAQLQWDALEDIVSRVLHPALQDWDQYQAHHALLCLALHSIVGGFLLRSLIVPLRSATAAQPPARGRKGPLKAALTALKSFVLGRGLEILLALCVGMQHLWDIDADEELCTFEHLTHRSCLLHLSIPALGLVAETLYAVLSEHQLASATTTTTAPSGKVGEAIQASAMFQRFSVLCLYPVLEKCACKHTEIAAMARQVLKKLYPVSLSELLLANCDYVLDETSRRLDYGGSTGSAISAAEVLRAYFTALSQTVAEVESTKDGGTAMEGAGGGNALNRAIGFFTAAVEAVCSRLEAVSQGRAHILSQDEKLRLAVSLHIRDGSNRLQRHEVARHTVVLLRMLSEAVDFAVSVQKSERRHWEPSPATTTSATNELLGASPPPTTTAYSSVPVTQSEESLEYVVQYPAAVCSVHRALLRIGHLAKHYHQHFTGVGRTEDTSQGQSKGTAAERSQLDTIRGVGAVLAVTIAQRVFDGLAEPMLDVEGLMPTGVLPADPPTTPPTDTEPTADESADDIQQKGRDAEDVPETQRVRRVRGVEPLTIPGRHLPLVYQQYTAALCLLQPLLIGLTGDPLTRFCNATLDESRRYRSDYLAPICSSPTERASDNPPPGDDAATIETKEIPSDAAQPTAADGTGDSTAPVPKAGTQRVEGANSSFRKRLPAVEFEWTATQQAVGLMERMLRLTPSFLRHRMATDVLPLLLLRYLYMYHSHGLYRGKPLNRGGASPSKGGVRSRSSPQDLYFEGSVSEEDHSLVPLTQRELKYVTRLRSFVEALLDTASGPADQEHVLQRCRHILGTPHYTSLAEYTPRCADKPRQYQ